MTDVLDPTIAPGQSGHRTDHETIAKWINGAPRVVLDCDTNGNIPVNGVLMDTIASLGGIGTIVLPPGDILFDPDLDLGDSIGVDAAGASGNVARNGATHLVKNGDGPGLRIGNDGQLRNIDVDGDNSTGILVHFDGERIRADNVSARLGETNFRWGSDDTDHNTSQFVGTAIKSYGSTGTDPYTGGCVFHDASGDPTDCDSGSIFGLESKGHAGNGCTWGTGKGWYVVQSRVSLNDGIGHELLAENEGLRLEMPYTEAKNGDARAGRDITIRAGASDYKITTPRWGTSTGNSWLDENSTPLGIVEYRPNKTARPTFNQQDIDRLIWSNPDISGVWEARQQSVSPARALEIFLMATSVNNVALRMGYGAFYDGTDLTKLIAMDIAGTVLVRDRFAVLKAIGLANGSNFEMSSSVGSMFGTASTQKMGWWGATPVVRPTITGSRDGNIALGLLLSALDQMGLVEDTTTG